MPVQPQPEQLALVPAPAGAGALLPPRRKLAVGARMICIGKGPGPKNVLAENPDGTKLVVPYGVWRWRPR